MGNLDNKVIWQTVAQLKCYRDGVLFGNGTGGCRWDGHTRIEVNSFLSPQPDKFFAVPG
jgi:hypothetical protein